MTDTTFFIDREELSRVFNPRAAMMFEEMQRRVASTEETVDANLGETGALMEAAFVTLSPNTELPNEYVLGVGEGLRLEVGSGTVSLFSDAPRVNGGHRLEFLVSGPSVVAVPLGGILATRDNPETLKNKTLDAPKLSGLVNAADDVAAASAGVPVEGVYRNGSVVQVRVS